MIRFKQHRSIVLASGSPRRKSYLERYQLQFTIVTADVDESVLPGEEPIPYARRLAKEKGETVADRVNRDDLIIAADTIVVLNNEILGKPQSKGDVLPMLERLNGKEHQVITSFFILDKQTGQSVGKDVTTIVRFNQTPADQLAAYAATTDPLDKAGAYSIQGIGTFLVHSIDGSYNNVVGLPVEVLLQELIKNNWLSL